MHVEVAIVGGGIYGTAAGYFISKAGIRVALVEEGAIGNGGATAFSRGIVRVYDPDPVLASLSLAGSFEFNHWEELGYPGIPPYRRTGCLYRVAPHHHDAAIRLTKELQGSGYNFEWLTSVQLASRFPFIRTAPEDLAIWEPDSGYGDPRLASENLAAASKTQGAVIYERCRAGAIDRGPGFWRISLPYGSITAQVVLLAGGATTRRLLPLLPIVTRSIGLLYMESGDMILQPAVPVIDEISGTYIRPLENGGYYCGTQVMEQADSPGDLRGFGEDHLTDASLRVQQLLKSSYTGRAVNGFIGFDAYTSNYRPLIGFMTGYEDLFVATGFSGRGFKYAMALSKGIAGQIGSRLGYNLPFPEIHPAAYIPEKVF